MNFGFAAFVLGRLCFAYVALLVLPLGAAMGICPSAGNGVDVPSLLMEIIDKEIYKEDYASITTYFQREPISYEDAIKSVEIIAKSGIFEE